MIEFFRFPHTPHLAWLGNTPPRGDKILAAAEARKLLSGNIWVEEKLDGANLGISAEANGELRFQNRGEYIVPPFGGQFTRLNAWIGHHGHNLLPKLVPGLILFGEWCAARHSVRYDHLPDWFIAFDVYDRDAGRFWRVHRRNAFAEQLGLPVAPCLLAGRADLSGLAGLATSSVSRFGSSLLEGLIVRHDGEDFLDRRAKLVRPGFLQFMGDHWRQRQTEWNQLQAP